MAIKELEMTWGERLREEGRQEGREKWREEGALAAKREMLLDVLRIRFGEVPDMLAATIAQADDTQLTEVLQRAVLATNLEELADR